MWNEKSEVSHNINAPPVLAAVPVTPQQMIPAPTLESGTFTRVNEATQVATYDDEDDDV